MQICRTKILGFTLLLAGLALGGAGLWLLLSPALYQAVAIIKIEPETHDARSSLNVSNSDPHYIQTELEVIQSPVILSNVVADLNLNEVWGERHKTIHETVYSWNEKLETSQSVRLLNQRLDLKRISNTKLVEIIFSSEDPKEAAKIADAVAQSYYDQRLDKMSGGIKAIKEQYRKAEQDIKAKRENLEQLGKQLNLPNPEPSEELLKTNYPSYFQTKQELQKTIVTYTQLELKIIGLVDRDSWGPPRMPPVQIINAAEPSEFPTDPNHPLGVVLLGIVFFPMLGGLLLLKSSRRQSAPSSSHYGRRR